VEFPVARVDGLEVFLSWLGVSLLLCCELHLMVDSCIFKIVWLWARRVQECATSNWSSFPWGCVFFL
jgi:hypothetical protein